MIIRVPVQMAECPTRAVGAFVCEIGAQVLGLDEALRGSVLTADPGMSAQTHPSQWTAHDLSTLLGDQDQGKPPQRRRAIRYALHFAAETPYGQSSTLNLWAPHRVDPA
jgi:hypothetical protein